MLAGFVLTLLQDRGDVDSNDDGKKVAPLSHVRREVRIDVQFNMFPPDREILQKIDLRMSNFVQGGWGGWPTGNGNKLSNSQACCLAQLCLAAA